jgi:hypothetical protein
LVRPRDRRRQVEKRVRLAGEDLAPVLVSSAFVDPADEELAAAVGACALVARTPGMDELLAAIGACLAHERSEKREQPVERHVVQRRFSERMAVHLDHQIRVSTRVNGLDQQVLEAVDLVLGRRGRRRTRERDRGNGREPGQLAQRRDHRRPIHVGQHHILDHERGRVDGCELEGFSPAGRRHRAAAGDPQFGAQLLTLMAEAGDDENSGRFRVHHDRSPTGSSEATRSDNSRVWIGFDT